MNDELELQQLDELDDDPELQLLDELDDEPPEIDVDNLDEPEVDDLLADLNAIKQFDFVQFSPEHQADVVEACKRADARKTLLRKEAEVAASEALAAFQAGLSGRTAFGYRFPGELVQQDVVEDARVAQDVVDDDGAFGVWDDDDDEAALGSVAELEGPPDNSPMLAKATPTKPALLQQMTYSDARQQLQR